MAKTKRDTKQEQLNRDYRKQRRRIQRYISQKEKAGIIIDYKVPDIPKRIRQESIDRLKNVDPTRIMKKAYTVDLDTGELKKYNYQKEQKKKRQEAAKRAAETRKQNREKEQKRREWLEEIDRLTEEPELPPYDKEEPPEPEQYSEDFEEPPAPDEYRDDFGQPPEPDEADPTFTVLMHLREEIQAGYAAGYGRNARIVESILEQEIEKIGEKEVAARLLEAPEEVIQYARLVIYASKQWQISMYLPMYIQIIRGGDAYDLEESLEMSDEVENYTEDYE